jgi:predicted transcriptional regulator
MDDVKVETEVTDESAVKAGWENLQTRLNQAASDIRGALNKGVHAAEPVFREKVAPALADATSKLSEMTESARKATAEKAGIEEDDLKPSAQISHGLAAIAAGLLGLSSSMTDWLSEHAANAAEGKANKADDVAKDGKVVDDEDVVDDVQAVADILNQPVVQYGDGDANVVSPS